MADDFKVRVVVPPGTEFEDGKTGEEAAADAGWTSDPGEGVTVLALDERGAPGYEVFNPLPFAPPIGWQPELSIEALIRERVRDEFERLKDDEEIDDIVDAEDFDVEDDDGAKTIETLYEFMAMEPEAPKLKAEEIRSPIQQKVDEEEALELERRIRRKRVREEYERRQAEARELYGDDLGREPDRSPPSPAVERALKRRVEE